MGLILPDETFFHQNFAAEASLLRGIRQSLLDSATTLSVPADLKFSFDPALAQVYITLFQPGLKPIRWGSRRESLAATLQRVVDKLRSHGRFPEFAVHDPGRCRLLFEVVTGEAPCDPRQTTIIHLNDNRLEPGVHGLRFRYEGQTYYFMPTDAVTHSLMTMNQVYNHLARRTGIAKKSRRISERVALVRNQITDAALITSFACVSYGDRALPLYRGYPVPVAIGRERLRECALAGVDWILSHMRPNGQFLYYYDGVTGSEIDFQHPKMIDPPYYNVLRHAGGTITLLRAFELTAEEKYLAGARASLDFFHTVLREHEVGGQYACYPICNRKGKLGGAGIGLVALLHYYRLSGDDRYRRTIDGLVRHILSRVSPSGEMIGYYVHPLFNNGRAIIDPDEQTKKELFSFYYPGEALLGLALYLRLVPGIEPRLREQVLAKSRSALDFLIHERPRKYHYLFEPLPADGWLMQAIEEWAGFEGFDDPAYVDFVCNDAQAMIDHMYQEHNSPYFDYPGAFFYHYGEHAYPDGARAEGLAAAWYLARRLGQEKRAAHFLNYLQLAAKNLLSTFNTPESCYAHHDPAKSAGSFRFKLTRQWVRVDSVQHAACFYFRLLPALEMSP